MTPRRPLPEPLDSLELTPAQRSQVHMAASLLLDYPDAEWFARLTLIEAAVGQLPTPIGELFTEFISRATAAGPTLWQSEYVTTFDLKRKCSLYLSYYAAGDTRRRGAALVTFLDAYRAAGWELTAPELPDYLPAVLELSAKSGSEVAEILIASHREGIEVLRAALEHMDSPWAALVRVVTLSLPPIDEATRERFLDLVSEGPPTEMVGLSFLGNLPPFSPHNNREEV